MQKLTISNGIITLPSRLKRAWEGCDVVVEERNNTLTVIETGKKGSSIDLDAWKKAAGILKGRIKEDPIIWQRTIRAEWDRVLP